MTGRIILATARRIALGADGRASEVAPAGSDYGLTLLEPFEPPRARRACDRFLSQMDGLRHASQYPRVAALRAIEALRDVRDAREFEVAIDTIFARISKSDHRPQHAFDLCVRLWEEGCIILPRGMILANAPHVFRGGPWKGRGYKAFPPLAGRPGEIVEEARRRAGGAEARATSRRVANLAFLSLVTTQGLAKGATPTWSEVREIFSVKSRSSAGTYLKQALVTLVSPGEPTGRSGPGIAACIERKAPLSDPEFRWVLGSDPAMEDWRSLVASWIRSLDTVRTTAHRSTGNAILRALLDLPAAFRDPRTFLGCDREHREALVEALRAPGQGDAHLSQMLRRAQAFFDHALYELAAEAKGSQRSGGDLRNPIPCSDIPRAPAPSRKTDKNPIPPEWVREMAQIIIEDDYAWPRSRPNDYFVGPGGGDRMWSPVRAWMMLALLSSQTRYSTLSMVDSGEGDPLLPTVPDGHGPFRVEMIRWLPNDRPAEQLRTKPLGVIRQRGRDDAALYFDANKGGRPFVSNWENGTVYRVICRLRAWQARNNPLDLPVAFERLPISNDTTKPGRRSQPARYYLFRDPTNLRDPGVPVSWVALARFFVDLQDEFERRMQAREMTDQDGAPIRLIRVRAPSGRPIKGTFTPHVTRVSTLTHLHDAGVPLPILRAEAAHKTERMTSYYIKQGISETRAVLNAAEAAMGSLASADHYLLDRAHDETASNDAGRPPEAVPDRCPGLRGPVARIPFPYGVCPNGASRCAESGLATPGPRGDPTSCLRCVHLLTGPAFAPEIARLHEEAVRTAMAADQDLRVLVGRRNALEGDAADGSSQAAHDEVACELAAARSRHGTAIDMLCGTASHRLSVGALLHAGVIEIEGSPVLASVAGSGAASTAAVSHPASRPMRTAARLVALGRSDDDDAVPAVPVPLVPAELRLARDARVALDRWCAAPATDCAAPAVVPVVPVETRGRASAAAA